MKYFLESITQQQIEQVTGKKIKRGTWKKGHIPTGNMVEVENPDGSIELADETRPGIMFEFEESLTTDEQEKIDRELVGFRREGGKTLGDEIAELKTKVAKLEAKK